MSYKVLIIDPIHQDAVEILKNAGFLVDEASTKSRAFLNKSVYKYDVVICRTSTEIDGNFLAKATSLKCIGLCSTGYDRIDIKEANRKGVAVIGLPSHNKKVDIYNDGNFISTAEHTLLLILASLRNFYIACQSIKKGKWIKSKLMGNELYGKTVGIIGFGRIGKLVALRLQVFGVRVLAYDPHVEESTIRKYKAEPVSLSRLCKQSDIITIHVHKNKDTIDLIAKNEIDMMKEGVILINTSRASVINEDLVLEALKKGKIKRFGVDVFHDEPNGRNRLLIQKDEVIATPHVGGSTHEALRRISISLVKNVMQYLDTGKTPNQINK